MAPRSAHEKLINDLRDQIRRLQEENEHLKRNQTPSFIDDDSSEEQRRSFSALPALLSQLDDHPQPAVVELTPKRQLNLPLVQTKAVTNNVMSSSEEKQDRDKSDSIYEQLSNILSLSELEALGDPSSSSVVAYE